MNLMIKYGMLNPYGAIAGGALGGTLGWLGSRHLFEEKSRTRDMLMAAGGAGVGAYGGGRLVNALNAGKGNSIKPDSPAWNRLSYEEQLAHKYDQLNNLHALMEAQDTYRTHVSRDRSVYAPDAKTLGSPNERGGTVMIHSLWSQLTGGNVHRGMSGFSKFPDQRDVRISATPDQKGYFAYSTPRDPSLGTGTFGLFVDPKDGLRHFTSSLRSAYEMTPGQAEELSRLAAENKLDELKNTLKKLKEWESMGYEIRDYLKGTKYP